MCLIFSYTEEGEKVKPLMFEMVKSDIRAFLLFSVYAPPLHFSYSHRTHFWRKMSGKTDFVGKSINIFFKNTPAL